MWSIISRALSLITENDPTLNNIILTTLKMAVSSSMIALFIGAPLGIIIGLSNFKGKNITTILLRSAMGLPPVVAGIVLYILFSGTGPFKNLGLIYSVELMIIAQVVLITPIIAGMTESFIVSISANILETGRGLNLSRLKLYTLTLNESKSQLVFIYLMGFSRAIAEVGAIQIVGGNILHKTRVMTTTIALNYNTGQFDYAIALGVILLIISVSVNIAAALLERRLRK